MVAPIKPIFDHASIARDTLNAAMESVRSLFPVTGQNRTLKLIKLWVGPMPPDDDYAAIKATIQKGGTWEYPILAELELVDSKTGKLIDRVPQMKLMGIPRFTPQFGYVVDGAMRYTQNQIRLKPGAYSEVANDGSFQTDVMTAKGHNFTLRLDPQTAVFTITPSTSSSNIRLLPVLEDLGLPATMLQRVWGSSVYQANAQGIRGDRAEELRKFHKALFGGTTPPALDAKRQIATYLQEKTEIRPETTQRTLGKAFERVSPELFLRATQRLLQISKGQSAPDDRNSPVNKELVSVDTFLKEYIRDAQRNIQTALLRQIEKRDKIREAVSPVYFNKSVKSFFGSSSLSNPIKQTNPVQMIGETLKATLMGEGGIGSHRAVTEDVRQVHGAQVGIIDPLHTPESQAIGTTVSVTLGATKKGNELAQYVVNLRTNRLEEKTAGELAGKIVAFPGQYSEVSPGRWQANVRMVKATRDGRELVVPAAQVDFVIPSAKGMFTLSSNLIPFLNGDAVPRAMVGSKQVEQAVPLKDPEAPLVQSSAGKGITFERLVGSETATRSKVAGKVTKVTEDEIWVGNTRHGIYNNFPLNAQTFLDSNPVVKVGDTVAAGALLADTNFSKNGVLAMGKNLLAAYLPHKGGYTFEDGITISESAAKRLTSTHMYRIPVQGGEHVRISTQEFVARYPQAFTGEQVAKLAPNGMAKIGAVLHKGDPVAVRLVEEVAGPEDRLMAMLRRGVNRPMKNRAILWAEDFPGTVIEVTPAGTDFVVTLKTEETARLGDKLALRHGAKGIISKVLPDSEMPHTLDGRPMEVLLNPQGVWGRQNVGQTLENLAGKVAEKTGKPVHVDNFSPGNQAQKVYDLARKHGLSDKEDLKDPETGRTIPQVAVGRSYAYKLEHLVRSKASARALGPYQEDGTPTRGDHQGGISMDMLTTYGLLAHGAKSILKESMSLKSEANPEWWRAYRRGQTLPLPRDTQSFGRFTDMLKGAGVNVERRGGEILLSPLLDKDVDRFSNGEIKTPLQLQAKNLSPEKYGLFDPKITGGMQGEGWGHIQLAEPIPHPTFEEPVKVLTGLTGTNYQAILDGKMFWDPERETLHPAPKKGFLTGGHAIQAMLKNIDVDENLSLIRNALVHAKGPRMDGLNKKYRYLNALKTAGKKPEDYVVTKLPVVPPKLRPVYPDESGNVRHSDLNFLYRDLMLVNQSLKGIQTLPDSEKVEQRRALYDGVKALAGLTSGPVLSQGQEKKGLLTQIAGTPQPKEGFFQRKLLKRRQDLTGKSTIVNAPELGIDEVGIPEEMAWKIFRERGIRELTTRGKTILDAQEVWDKRTPEARDILAMVFDTQPVLLNRAPSLHKFSIQAFYPKIRPDAAIGLHPLNVKGFNADFDGDNMFVHVPVLPESIEEAKRLVPSQNLFNPRDNSLMVMPDQEAVQGLFLLTREGPKTKKSYTNEAELLRELEKGTIQPHHVVTLSGKPVTPGRILVNAVLPAKFKDPARVWSKKAAAEVLTRIAREEPKLFPAVVNRLKDLGNRWAYLMGSTLGVSDLLVDTKERDQVLLLAERAATQVDLSRKFTQEQKDAKKIQIFQAADKDIATAQKRLLAKNPDSQMSLAVNSGASGKATAGVKQVALAPVLYERGQGQPVPILVRRSLSEGLDAADYWASTYGGRKGMMDKTLATAKPGEMTKAVINALGKYVITKQDCGTKRGAPFLLVDPVQARDVVGNILVESVAGLSPGVVLRPEHVQQAFKQKVARIVARSPLTCEAAQGVCAYCYGYLQDRDQFPSIGTNVGAVAAHSVGEPGTQTVLKAFHTAGVSSAGATVGITSQFDRIDQILSVPKNLPYSTTLAETSGSVGSIEPAPAGGFNVMIGGIKHFIRPGLTPSVTAGQQVQKGQALSSGSVNPHDVLRLKGLDATREHISQELHRTYNSGGTPIRKAHTDLVARAMTNYGKVIDPGDAHELIPGDTVPASVVQAQNRTLTDIDMPLAQAAGRVLAKPAGPFPVGTPLDLDRIRTLRTVGVQSVRVKPKQTLFQPILTSVAQAPLQSTDWLSRLGATGLKKTILEGASKLWRSSVHGPDPIPGLAVGTEFGDDPSGLY